MQGAILNHADLRGAIVKDADLEAVSLNHAHLEGADLSGAKISAADFRSAGVWMTRPPEADASGAADFSELALRAVTETDAAQIKQTLERVKSRRLKAQVAEALAPILNVAENGSWNGSADMTRWQSFMSSAAPPVPAPAPVPFDPAVSVPTPVSAPTGYPETIRCG